VLPKLQRRPFCTASPDGGAPRRRPVTVFCRRIDAAGTGLMKPKARLQGVCKRQLQYLSSLARGFVGHRSRSERQFSCTRRLFLGKPASRAQTVQKSGQFFSVSSAFEVMTGDKSPALRRSNREKNSRSRLQSAFVDNAVFPLDFPALLGFPKFLTTDGSKASNCGCRLAASEPPRERVPQPFQGWNQSNTGIRRSGIARCVMALLWLWLPCLAITIDSL